MAPDLAGKIVVLGVTGGIAAYKSAELCRLLVKAGAQVRVVMTEAACQFITPITMQALSGHPVALDLFAPISEGGIGHIELASRADLVVIAPATADASGAVDVSGVAAAASAADHPAAPAPALHLGPLELPALTTTALVRTFALPRRRPLAGRLPIQTTR